MYVKWPEIQRIVAVCHRGVPLWAGDLLVLQIDGDHFKVGAVQLYSFPV